MALTNHIMGEDGDFLSPLSDFTGTVVFGEKSNSSLFVFLCDSVDECFRFQGFIVLFVFVICLPDNLHTNECDGQASML